MKLSLKNFKCWDNRTFDLHDKGIILISGKSGRGKTSILDAIYFVLFGKGKKVCTFGKRHCTVSITYQGMDITRTKCPNRLVLIREGETYEDEAAQSIINQFFNKFFNVSSYMQQNLTKSFLLLSPLDKLAFLEYLTFQNLDIKEIKCQVKNLVKKRQIRLIELDTKINTLQEVLEHCKVPEPIILNFKYSTRKSKITQLENNKKRINNYKNRIHALQERITDTKVLNSFLEEYEFQLSRLQNKVKNIPTNTIDYDTALTIAKNKLTDIENYESEQIKVIRLKEIEAILWKETSKKECEEMIDGYKQYLNDIRKINKLEDKLSKLTLYDNYTELKKQVAKVLQCPNCKMSVYYDMEKEVLLLHDSTNNDCNKDEILSKISTHEKNQIKWNSLSNLKNDIVESYEIFNLEDKNNIKTELHNIEEYYQTHLALKHEKNNLVITNLSKPLENKTELEEEIVTLKVKAREYNKNREKLTELNNDINNLNYKKDNKMNLVLKKYGKKVSVSKLTEKLNSLQDKMNNLILEVSSLTDEIKKIEQFEQYNKAKKEYDMLRTQIEELSTEQKITSKNLTSSLLLKSLIQKAESIAITNIINSINTYAQNYLDIFFTENPISVLIQPFKKSKKGKKSQINIAIHYKGIESDLDSLSGGERQRVLLAFTMALAEIYQSPFLLLDECTSNLDQELTETVINGIKSSYNGELVILIAHQVVTGKFDSILTL